MSAEAKPSNWNVPNALTTLRIAMVPFFAWALLADGGESVLWRTVAWLIFVAAMITDKIDGDLARKHNLVTDFGKIADPIADKALTGMAFIGLSMIGEIWWWVTILVLVREWSVTLMRLSIAKHVVLAANQSGKLKTMLQALALSLLILPLRELEGPLATLGLVVWWVAVVVLAAAVVMTVYSGYEFFRDAFKQRRHHRTTASV
ncbi:MAG TPA: CDP-diacylglycerol--glycerol-3-phosphate 3-phosphatidyltransferase [Nocardioidaceae bacterium]|nr:CDP-diacylglycerol--glycerol-3-phosphate 3-phosphatidyltransferase [Nocardioidaceae bacterium]